MTTGEAKMRSILRLREWVFSSLFWIRFFSAATAGEPVAGNPDPAFTTVVSRRCAEAGRIALQSDGKILVNGSFASVGGVLVTANGKHYPGLARLNVDGSLDKTFHPALAGVPVPQADGRIVILDFNKLARLNPDGRLDPFFRLSESFSGSDFNSLVALQPDGRILIANGWAGYLIRLRPDGTTDPEFHQPEFDKLSVSALAVQADGKILIGGDFKSVNGIGRPGLARLQTRGDLDTGFNPAALPGVVGAIATLPDDKVLVGGTGGLLRLNGDGSIDSKFSPTVGSSLFAVARDGKIVVKDSDHVRRLNADGTIDPSFALTQFDFIGTINALLIQPDGKVLVSGFFQAAGTLGRAGLARLNSNGTVDVDFDPQLEFPGEVSAVLAGSDGKMLVGGSFDFVNGVPANGIARLNPDGSVDRQFRSRSGPLPAGLGPFSRVSAMTKQTDGKIVVAGHLVDYAGVSPSHLVRLYSDGVLDLDFQPGDGTRNDGRGATISTLKAQPDGRLLVGGSFDHFSGVARSGLVRLERDGNVDRSFLHGSGATGGDYSQVRAVELQSDGAIVVGGDFTFFDDRARLGLARLLANGELDDSFLLQPGAVYSVTVQADDRILICRGSRPWLERFDRDGNPELDFQAGITNLIYDPPGWRGGAEPKAVVQPDGKIVIASVPVMWNAGPGVLGRLNSDGSVDDRFRVSYFQGQAVALDPDGNTAVVGGFFWHFDELSRSSLARVFLAQQAAVHQPGWTRGRFQFFVAGQPLRTYRIERSVDLVNWVALGTVCLGEGPVSFTDYGPPIPRAFYRATLSQ